MKFTFNVYINCTNLSFVSIFYDILMKMFLTFVIEIARLSLKLFINNNKKKNYFLSLLKCDLFFLYLIFLAKPYTERMCSLKAWDKNFLYIFFKKHFLFSFAKMRFFFLYIRLFSCTVYFKNVLIEISPKNCFVHHTCLRKFNFVILNFCLIVYINYIAFFFIPLNN